MISISVSHVCHAPGVLCCALSKDSKQNFWKSDIGNGFTPWDGFMNEIFRRSPFAFKLFWGERRRTGRVLYPRPVPASREFWLAYGSEDDLKPRPCLGLRCIVPILSIHYFDSKMSIPPLVWTNGTKFPCPGLQAVRNLSRNFFQVGGTEGRDSRNFNATLVEIGVKAFYRGD